jgi:phospholipid transport system substrate-binding protein
MRVKLNSGQGTWLTGVHALVGAAVLLGGAPVQAAVTATESVKGTIAEVLHILEDQELKSPGRMEERRHQLEQVIGGRFSYDEMAKRSLGAQWVKLNDKERQEFVELFRQLLTNSYVGKIEGYSGEQIHYLNERLQDDYAEVRTKITSGKTEIPLDYRLLKKSGDWRVYDVIVDGISLVNNYRGQFAKIIRSSSYEDLVEKLRTKSETFAAPKKTDDKAR